MTSETRSFSTPPLGVLAEINQRLAAITPEQFVAPDLMRGENDHIVAMATDEIKKLFTLRATLTEDLNRSAVNCGTKALQYMRDVRKLISEDPLGENPQALESLLSEQLLAMEKMKADLALMKRFVKIVDGSLWLEVRRQHPELAARPVVGVYSDWSLCWRDDSDDEEDVEDVFRILRISGSGSADDLSALLLGLGGGR